MEPNYQITNAQPALPAQMAAPPMMAAPNAASDAGASIDLKSIIDALKRRWWLVALCALVGGGLAFFKIMRSEARYVSSAAVEVAQGNLRILNIEEINPEDLGDLEVLKTIEQNFGSSSLMLRVADTVGLRQDPDFQGYGGNAFSDAQLAGILGGMIKVELRRGTRLIDITVEDTDPERAQKLAQTMVEEFIKWEVEDGRSVADDAHQSLVAESDRLEEQLKESEQKLVEYRESNRTVTLQGKESILDEKAKSLNSELAKTKSERMRLEADLEQVGGAKAINATAALLLPSVSTKPEIVALRTRIGEKEADFAMVKKEYLWKHPEYIRVDSELSELKALLNREATRAANGMQSALSALTAKEGFLEKEVRSQREELLELQRVLGPYKSMLQEVDADRKLYASMRQRQKEANATGKVERSPISLKEGALVPSDPVWPNKKILLGLGLFAGGFLGSCLVIGGALFDRSFKSQEQAERFLGMPLLAAIPTGEDATEVDEAYRTLRTSLTFVGKGAHARSIMFASARDDEGAEECAIQCARAFARQGQRTLLIDANLRSPSLDQSLMGRRLPQGLVHYLQSEGDAGQVVHPTENENLYILPAGTSSSNAAELLASPRLTQMIEESKQWFQKIVITTPALGEVSDGLLAARHADSVCMIVEADRTARAEVFRSCQLLSMAGAPPVGFALTGAKPKVVAKRGRKSKERSRHSVFQRA